MEYITLTFDLVNSRDIYDRNNVQIILIEAIKECNEKYKDIIVSKFLIILGDEWQGLLKEGANYTKIIAFFREKLPQFIEFYVGIGIGKVTVNNFELTVNQLDGPSFYLAREALNYAKSKNHKLVVLRD